MTDSSRPHLEDQMDRCVRGELTAEEARALAQKSLDDPELFNDLTFSAVAKAGLAAAPRSEAKLVRFPRRARIWIAGAAAAAALVAVSIYSLRGPIPRETASVAVLTPVLTYPAKPGQPVLLASDLDRQPTGRDDAPVFRSPSPDSREPREAGSIVSIEDGLVSIDLGSVDGVAKGSELRVFREERSTQPIGRLLVTTVFRERARGTILDGGPEIHVNNRIRVPSAAYLGAILEQVGGLSSRGDSDAARKLAEKAAAWAEAAKVPPGESRKVLEQLAALEYQAGSLQAAATHYRSAVDSLRAEPAASIQEQSVALNNLAVLHMLRGDYAGAEAPLNLAVSTLPKTEIGYGRSLNNLGVLAEARGDRGKAAALYTDAARVFAGVADSGPERRAVEANLARTRGSR